VRARELAGFRIDRNTLARACKHGLVERLTQGMYQLPGVPQNPIAVACKRIPQGVVCLVSALAFHELIEDQPPEIWMAIGSRARIPQPNGLQMKFVRFSGDASTQGVQNLNLDGVPVRVYSPMKSVADCLKFRNKVGVEVARSALKASMAKRSYSRERLVHFARICRVEGLLLAE
jgi:predicted transcriptional regulator of viral defense system